MATSVCSRGTRDFVVHVISTAVQHGRRQEPTVAYVIFHRTTGTFDSSSSRHRCCSTDHRFPRWRGRLGFSLSSVNTPPKRDDTHRGWRVSPTVGRTPCLFNERERSFRQKTVGPENRGTRNGAERIHIIRFGRFSSLLFSPPFSQQVSKRSGLLRRRWHRPAVVVERRATRAKSDGVHEPRGQPRGNAVERVNYAFRIRVVLCLVRERSI